MTLISSTEILCIIFILLMCTERSGVLAKPEGGFLVNSAYLESPFLYPKLVADVIILSGLESGLLDAILPSVGHSQFEFILPLRTAAGVAVLGGAVLVSVWDVWVVLVRAGKADQSSLPVRTLGEKSGASGSKKTMGVAKFR